MIKTAVPAFVSCVLLMASGAFAEASKGPAPAAAAATPPSYASDAVRSRLEFSGMQAGAAFKGVFKKFAVTARFNPAQPEAGRIEVQIDVDSLDSQDEERDKALRGAEFFDTAKIPGAHYVTRGITRTAQGFAAVGTLTLRGVSRDVPIDFQFTPVAGAATLIGNSTIKRLDFGVGQSEWKSTEWVGDEVKIHFSVSLKPVP